MSREPLLLLHAGGLDGRMWGPLAELVGGRYDVLAPDMRPAPATRSTRSSRCSTGGHRAHRRGGRVLRRQRRAAAGDVRAGRVSALVLFASALGEHEPSPELLAFFEAEERLVEAGDIEGAVALGRRTWVREAAIGDLVDEMARDGFARELAAGGHPEPLGVDLAAIAAPTLAVSGGLDFPDFAAIADRIAAAVPGARRAAVPDAGHLIALERPQAAAELLLGFLRAG